MAPYVLREVMVVQNEKMGIRKDDYVNILSIKHGIMKFRRQKNDY